ncbi:MAG: hypothetical protein GY738_12910, partial [Pseudoalteromonas sp.]|nr:hypothetical protein [Pseudoalteromonas sp.]
MLNPNDPGDSLTPTTKSTSKTASSSSLPERKRVDKRMPHLPGMPSSPQRRWYKQPADIMQVPIVDCIKPSKSAKSAKSADEIETKMPNLQISIKPVSSKLARQIAEQNAAVEPYPELPTTPNQRPAQPNLPIDKEHSFVGRLCQNGRAIIIDDRWKNFGLPEFSNTIGLEDLSRDHYHHFPGICDMGHGYHFTTNPACVFNWSDHSEMPIAALHWEDQFVSQGDNAPKMRDWRDIS